MFNQHFLAWTSISPRVDIGCQSRKSDFYEIEVFQNRVRYRYFLIRKVVFQNMRRRPLTRRTYSLSDLVIFHIILFRKVHRLQIFYQYSLSTAYLRFRMMFNSELKVCHHVILISFFQAERVNRTLRKWPWPSIKRS